MRATISAFLPSTAPAWYAYYIRNAHHSHLLQVHADRRSIGMILLFVVAALALFVIFEMLWLKLDGKPVPTPVIPREAQTIGSGPALRYAILGDSTAIAQGANYAHGYAVATADQLAKNHTVTWQNLAISGATAQDVQTVQLAEAVRLKPDIVLVAVGANDVMHLTKTSSYSASLTHIIATLRSNNPAIRIVITGAPAMGAIPRLPQPVRWFAGKRTVAINAAAMAVARAQPHVTFAPIAVQTGPIFQKHPEYFAADKFHPNNAGYAVWVPVLEAALAQAQR